VVWFFTFPIGPENPGGLKQYFSSSGSEAKMGKEKRLRRNKRFFIDTLFCSLKSNLYALTHVISGVYIKTNLKILIRAFALL
jgi:hypothetical protein